MNLDRLPAHLHDMRGFVRELRGLLVGMDVHAFLGNRVLCLAVEKLFINLGEAASVLATKARGVGRQCHGVR